MIHVDWVDPNFEVEVEDLDGNVLPELHWSQDKDALQRRLDQRVQARRIRAVRSIKVYDFTAWRRRADEARRAAQTLYDNGTIADWVPKSAIWSDLKPYLIQLFHHKCAYCESSFDHVSWGDVEHYRPKKKVTDEQDTQVSRRGVPHPGYFWLAYEPTNLLPSCTLCNQALAKMNHFPVTGARAWAPADDLSAEEPLLLHPYADRPDVDLAFAPKYGTVEGVTDRGQMSTKFYRLNREALLDKRREQQGRVRKAIMLAFAQQDPDTIDEIKRECVDGEAEFSRAGLAEFNDYFKSMHVRYG